MRIQTYCAAILMSAAWPLGTAAQSTSVERLRLAQLTGDTGSTTRHAPSEGPSWRFAIANARVDLTPLLPSVRVVWNSAIPFSLNDGPLWAGRGTSIAASAGMDAIHSLRSGARIRLRIVPSIVYSQNLPFQVIPSSSNTRSGYASPFHNPPASADLPLRFGDRHVLRVDPGNSSLELRVRAIVVALTAVGETWGPGIRNQLVMSANAPGIPRLQVQTDSSLRTRLGLIDATMLAGALTESAFFDDAAGNNLRSISAFLVQLRPAFDTSLTVGLTRVVYRPVGPFDAPFGTLLLHSLDALTLWEHLAAPGDEDANGTPHQRGDQITGMFARWLVPGSGFEVYGEWTRMELPRSLAEVFTAFHHTLGYTIGFQYAAPRGNHHHLRLQAEATNLEQSRVYDDRPPPDYYTGRVSAHGYTNRGQIVGAAIGPGASSQWIALDYFAPEWQVGSYVGRIRWENDAMYRQSVPHLFLHDVTALAGVRAARRTRWSRIAVDATFGYRFNYLFQNGIPQPGGHDFRTVDVRNFTFSLAVTPR